MSKLTDHCGSKCLKKQMGTIRIYLYKGFDFANGFGWFCHAYNLDSQDHTSTSFSATFGFHKTNRFTSVKMALNDFKDLKGNLSRQREVY